MALDRKHFKLAVKAALARAGALMPPSAMRGIDAGFSQLALGHWMKRRGFKPELVLAEREELFERMAEYIGHSRTLYLEFGVASGKSMRAWSELLTHPESRLHGFDSFDGLPVDWIHGYPAGHFSQEGEPPELQDPRAEFFKGWFDETLPRYEMPEGFDRLVVNVDADLYSSTAVVLDYLRDKVRPGTFLYFDEFNHHSDEMRAFDEFLSATGLQFRLFGVARGVTHAAFEAVD